MKRIIPVILLTLLSFTRTSACLNGEMKVLKDGTYLYEDGNEHVPYGHSFSSPEDFREGVKRLDSLYKATSDLDYLSDKGLLLILLKQYEEAIHLYRDIEKMQPGRYATASNMGTAYELMGQNDSALKWIRRSVAIDPESHKSSEWIHVNILEAKIKGETSYTTNFLLGTDFGTDARPRSAMSREALEKLSDALYFQLNERVSFVKPKEKIVAQLLFDLGNIAFLLGRYSEALLDYERANTYGFSQQLMKQRIKEADRLSRASRAASGASVTNMGSSGKLTYGLAIAGATLLIITGLFVARKRKKNST